MLLYTFTFNIISILELYSRYAYHLFYSKYRSSDIIVYLNANTRKVLPVQRTKQLHSFNLSVVYNYSNDQQLSIHLIDCYVGLVLSVFISFMIC